jgi:FkbM family methyltransferase
MHALNRVLEGTLGLHLFRVNHPSLPFVRHYPARMLDYVLSRLWPDLQGLHFVQIGANDGVQNDPIVALITRYAWHGVMVEPLPQHLAALRSRYGNNPRVTLVAAALDAQAGRRALYDINPGTHTLPQWSRGLASFSRERVLEAAQSLDLPPSCVQQTEVATVTWNHLWGQCPHARCDILIMDTEGFDLELLKLADLGQLKPRVIQFEHACASPADRLAFYGQLIAFGYEIATDGPDTVAWLPPPPCA